MSNENKKSETEGSETSETKKPKVKGKRISTGVRGGAKGGDDNSIIGNSNPGATLSAGYGGAFFSWSR